MNAVAHRDVEIDLVVPQLAHGDHVATGSA
jgi:hypothetical protein